MSEKLYKIGEAAELLKLKSYVLRFWEMEFPQLAPTRTQTGQRLYTEKDLSVLKRIRHLLHERGLTIEGARKLLAEDERRPAARGRQTAASQGSTLFEVCDMDAPAPSVPPEEPVPAQAERKAPEGAPAAGMHAPEIQAIVEELSALRAMLAGKKKNEPSDAGTEDILQ